mgnify:CR=1 FL=1
MRFINLKIEKLYGYINKNIDFNEHIKYIKLVNNSIFTESLFNRV